MAEQPNISSILAALAAQRGAQPQGGQPQPQYQQQPGLPQGFPGAYGSPAPPPGAAGFPLPQPTNSGSLDLSSIKPVNSGTVSIAEAIAKARGIAAEKGVSYDSHGRSSRSPNRGADPRMRGYRRSPSRSPPPTRRDAFRDNYNPYRDERRGDRRGGTGGRDRSFSPGPRDRQGDSFRPSSSREYGARGGGNRSPVSRGDENVEMIQIDSSLVGLIIGRQGENLRRVEQDTGCRVQFITGPDVSGPKRDCKITGPLRARTDAKAEIFRIIEENGRGPGLTNLGRGSGLPPTRDSGSNQPPLRDGEATTQIMVPDRTVGLIIGKGGETIRDLQERSGCHVNIVGEQKSVNGLRPVNLIGSAQAAAMAKNLIMEIVDSDTKSLSNPVGGSRDSQRGNAYGGSGQGGGGDRTSDTITVPSSAVGMIIGKGGETIKEMQNQSNCKINVSPQTNPNEVDRDIGLVGTREAIEHAKRLIDDKVDIVTRGNSDGGRGGSGGGRNNDSYGDRYSQPQQPYGQGQSQAPVQAQPQAQAPQTQEATPAGGEDPYAAYGGYQNYVAMWYAAMAQQQQQAQGQGPGEQRPPGAA